MRDAYLPRTNPPGKSESLYSTRSSSETRELGFFIKAALSASGKTRTDDTDDLAFLGVRYYEKAA